MSPDRKSDERILQRLRLRDVRLLVTVAECGSMGKAAAQLSLSQPAISKAIAGMEHTLGVPLLDRTAQGVEPTIYGRALLKWATAFFDDLRQGVREIEFLTDPTAGEVRIGSDEAMTAGLVPAIVERLSRKFPRLAFRVTQAPVLGLHRELRERHIDLILGRMITPTADETLNAEVLIADDPLLVVTGIKSKWHRRRSVDLAELMNEPWCLPPADSYIGTLVVEAFRVTGSGVPRHTVTSTSIQLVSAMLVSGRFLAVLSSSTMQMSAGRLGLKPVAVDLPIRGGPVGIVTLKNRTLGPVAQLFIDAAREVAKPLARKR